MPPARHVGTPPCRQEGAHARKVNPRPQPSNPIRVYPGAGTQEKRGRCGAGGRSAGRVGEVGCQFYRKPGARQGRGVTLQSVTGASRGGRRTARPSARQPPRAAAGRGHPDRRAGGSGGSTRSRHRADPRRPPDRRQRGRRGRKRRESQPQGGLGPVLQQPLRPHRRQPAALRGWPPPRQSARRGSVPRRGIARRAAEPGSGEPVPGSWPGAVQALQMRLPRFRGQVNAWVPIMTGPRMDGFACESSTRKNAVDLWESRGLGAGAGGSDRPRDFQRPVGARRADPRMRRDADRASTGRAGPQHPRRPVGPPTPLHGGCPPREGEGEPCARAPSCPPRVSGSNAGDDAGRRRRAGREPDRGCERLAGPVPVRGRRLPETFEIQRRQAA